MRNSFGINPRDRAITKSWWLDNACAVGDSGYKTLNKIRKPNESSFNFSKYQKKRLEPLLVKLSKDGSTWMIRAH